MRGDGPSLADVDESSYIDSLQHLGPGPSTESDPVPDGLASPRTKLNAAWRFGLQSHGHRKNESQRSLYDGSDYGNDSDFEEDSDLSPVLEQRLAAIDNLVKLSTAESRVGGDQVIERMINGLRDLGGQSKVETSASRLITAHTAITSHLKHQTRTLQNLIHPLLYSHFPALSTDAIDDLLTLIDDLIPMLPFPTPIPNTIEPSSLPIPSQQQHHHHPSNLVLSRQPDHPSSRISSLSLSTPLTSPPLLDEPSDHHAEQAAPELSGAEVLVNNSSRSNSSSSNSSSTSDPLISLRALLAQTSDITHALRFISDTIHESRQLTSVASRRLKNVRELVADIRREDENREEGTRFIEKGDWDRRLSDREAGKVCKDVVSGFEEVCGVWRERLFGQVGAAEAVAA
ncbi:hypothetical protein KEM54_002752 [Ascosphaera aggregata]|nr:hypothetical protein KEM54_002752 [Ascosphaera aggregata]